MRVGIPDLPDHRGLTPHLLADLILVERVEHLAKAHLRRTLLNLSIDGAEEIVQHSLISAVAGHTAWRLNDAGSFRQHDHVVVSDSAFNQFFGVFLELPILEEQSLLEDGNL